MTNSLLKVTHKPTTLHAYGEGKYISVFKCAFHNGTSSMKLKDILEQILNERKTIRYEDDIFLETYVQIKDYI